MHGLGARFHTPLHSCCFFRRKVHRQRYTKKRRRTKSQNCFENVCPANSFCFFFARNFVFDFSLSNGTKTPLFRDNFGDLGRFSPTSQADFANQRDGPSFNDFCNEKRRDGLKKSQKYLHQKKCLIFPSRTDHKVRQTPGAALMPRDANSASGPPYPRAGGRRWR